MGQKNKFDIFNIAKEGDTILFKRFNNKGECYFKLPAFIVKFYRNTLVAVYSPNKLCGIDPVLFNENVFYGIKMVLIEKHIIHTKHHEPVAQNKNITCRYKQQF